MGAIDKLRSSRPVALLGPGDMISVTIYEAGSALFSGRRAVDTGTSADPALAPPGSSGETLPRLQVDRNGTISIPYAGTIKVAGHTTAQVQRMIEADLYGRLTGSDGESVDAVAALRGSYTC